MSECICADLINCNPDPMINPDCPIHGSLRRKPKDLEAENAELRQRVEKLVEAGEYLVSHGEHLRWCDTEYMDGKCGCGINNLKAALDGNDEA